MIFSSDVIFRFLLLSLLYLIAEYTCIVLGKWSLHGFVTILSFLNWKFILFTCLATYLAACLASNILQMFRRQAVNGCLLWKRKGLYSKHLQIYYKVLDDHVFYFRICLCLFWKHIELLKVHSAWIKEIRLRQQVIIKFSLCFSHLVCFLMSSTPYFFPVKHSKSAGRSFRLFSFLCSE